MLKKKITFYIRSIARYIFILTIFQAQNISAENRVQRTYDIAENAIYQTCFCDFCNELRTDNNVKTYRLCIKKKGKICQKITTTNPNKRTVMIYMAADNDLRPFAARNIQQMANIGSNHNVTIIVHLDIRISGNKKITRRYLIEKEQVLHIDPHNPLTQQMDSGNPATLISFCEWAIKNYPAGTYDLILWNHGTGILEPPHGKIIHPMDLFVLNPNTHLLDLDRSIGFMDALLGQACQRGVCWDDTTGNYLSNRKLETALDTICQKYLKGKKFGIIGFDACLMSMIEVGSFIKRYADFMVSSEEVELGMGWKYDEVLFPFSKEALSTRAFAAHIVSAYNKTYQTITNDYTLSAIELENIALLEKNIDYIAKILIDALSREKGGVYLAIKESKSRTTCTHFDEPTYIDLHHFYKNLYSSLLKNDSKLSQTVKKSLLAALDEGMQLIDQLVVANTTGKNLRNAHGIAIYFPERNVHSSYKEAVFLKNNAWGNLISRYVFG